MKHGSALRTERKTMEPITPNPVEAAAAANPATTAKIEGTKTEGKPVDSVADEYEPVTGRSLAEVEQVRMLESVAAQKVARDYEHVIWAYGILWALFACYGIFLWRRSARLRADMNALRRELGSA